MIAQMHYSREGGWVTPSRNSERRLYGLLAGFAAVPGLAVRCDYFSTANVCFPSFNGNPETVILLKIPL